jgi:hypothetical protein
LSTVRRNPKPREVVNVIDSRQVIIDTTIPNLQGHIEVREHLNGSFTVWYPDEAFCPCSPVCSERHTHSFKQGFIQSTYSPVDRADAEDWATKLAEGREVKFVKIANNRAKKGAS